MPNVTIPLALIIVLAILDTMVTGKVAKVKENERNVREVVYILHQIIAVIPPLFLFLLARERGKEN